MQLEKKKKKSAVEVKRPENHTEEHVEITSEKAL